MDNYRLVELLSLVSRRMHRYLVPVAEAEGLSFTEIVVLWKMNRRKACRVTDLAGEVSMPPSTLTGVLDRLVAKGLLVRVPDPEDRRAVILTVGEHVPDLLETMKDASRERLSAAFRAVPDEHLERLAGDLQELLDCLEGEDEESV